MRAHDGRLGHPLGTASYHVRVLADLGVVEFVSTRQRRGATEHIYKARPHPQPTTPTPPTTPGERSRADIREILEHTHRHATRSAAAGGFDHADARFERHTLRLDPPACEQLAAAIRQWLSDTAEIERHAAERIAANPDMALDAALVLMPFQALPFSAPAPA